MFRAGGALTYTGISNLYVPAGGATRHIGHCRLAAGRGGRERPAKLEMTYDMTVIDQGGKWNVHE